ncbi:MAG: LPS export ABC transporter periplasmic protein LptC [Desulfobulbaceae bacterium]|nr:LPS export ABC transporter periplasmic protein LptC [Desulfobulbaceae bacterium]
MIKNPRNLLWLIPLLFFLTSPVWKPSVANFLQPRGGYDKNLAMSGAQQSQNFIMDSITLTLTTNGRQEWVVNAERAFTGKTDREIGMIEVDALYTSRDKALTKITSNRGTYLLDDRHLMLIDNVVIKKPKTGEEMYTDLLHYYDATKMVVSPEDVDLKGPKFSLQAGRMDYDLSTDGYDFSDRVIVDL